jgi:hypothetical protein
VVFVAQLVARGEERNRLLEVHSRAERPIPAGGQDRHPEVVVVVELHEGLVQTGEHVRRQRVHRIGAIDGDGGDAVLLLVSDARR